jgi:hypothetical protein
MDSFQGPTTQFFGLVRYRDSKVAHRTDNHAAIAALRVFVVPMSENGPTAHRCLMMAALSVGHDASVRCGKPRPAA